MFHFCYVSDSVVNVLFSSPTGDPGEITEEEV